MTEQRGAHFVQAVERAGQHLRVAVGRGGVESLLDQPHGVETRSGSGVGSSPKACCSMATESIASLGRAAVLRFSVLACAVVLLFPQSRHRQSSSYDESPPLNAGWSCIPAIPGGTAGMVTG